VPPLEVWEKYQIKDDFLDDAKHSAQGCTGCHSGVELAADKPAAHEGLVRDPIEDRGNELCGGCHSAIFNDYETSIHYTQAGYGDMLLQRSGAAELTADMELALSENCTKCHTTCGQCHISRPFALEGGFISGGGHIFRPPSQTNNCTACHGSRISEEFKGSREGYDPDTHYLSGMTCFGCHSASEIHGDGTQYTHRYDVAELNTCASSGCHDSLESNMYHDNHVGLVQCQVCHSQDYKVCYECHAGDGLQFPSRIDFRIGLNPKKSAERPENYVLLRHIPIHPDTYTNYDVTLDNFDSMPTWKYASPHNIRLNTPRTASCAVCHSDTLENPSVFLTEDYIQSLITEGVMVSEELAANADVVVPEIPGMGG